MSNNFTIDQLTKSQTIDPNSINRIYKINMMLNFMERRSNNPRMTQNQNCRQLGTSDSTIERYRDDISMDSPCKRSTYKKKTNNQKSNTNTTSIQDPPKNETSKTTTNKKTKSNILKGGNPNDEQPFQIDKTDSILENKQEDNTKFITIAGRMVDNV